MPLFLAGLAALLLSAAAAAVLVYAHVTNTPLPGCGVNAGCAELTTGDWGRIPFLDAPVSYVGLGWFIAAIAGWTLWRIRRRPPMLLPTLWRLAALASLGFVAVMLILGKFCLYCSISHLGDFLFLALAETALMLHRRTTDRSAPRPAPPAAAPRRADFRWGLAAISLLAASVAAGAGVQAMKKHTAQLADESALAEDIKALTAPRTAADPAPAEPYPFADGFTGRYRWGDEDAPIRIVMFLGYQCQDCRRIDQEVIDLLNSRRDVSLSVKQFPLCTDCNPHMPRNMHPNGCWAARAAETAGLLKGNPGYWEMHMWLFERGGGFTDAELDAGLRQMGYDPAVFTALMQGEETLKRVKSDIEEGVSLGLFYTPMIFINGVELKGWNAPKAVTRAVEALAATKPPRATAANDRPPLALERYISDWADARQENIAPDSSDWYIGPDGPATGSALPIRIVIFGDYQEPYTRQADAAVRALVAKRTDVRYSFRHYPINANCNRHATYTAHAFACDAHKAAEAAGQLGGPETYWAMHTWLLDNQQGLTLEAVLDHAESLGLDRAEFRRRMEFPEIRAAIEEDVAVAGAINVRGVPTVMINDKLLPRWLLKDRSIIEDVVKRAAGETTPPKR